MRKKLYLANPYGFSKQTKTLLDEFIQIFNDLNVEVYEPFERAKPLTKQKSQWAYEVANSNFCLLYTSPSPRDLAVSRMPSSA